MNNLVDVQNLKKFFKSGDDTLKVLDGLDLQVKKGSIITITGESGVGKSTLLALLGGLDYVTDGQIIIQNQDITKLAEKEMTLFRCDNIGFVFQHHFLLPEFTAYENIILPYLIKNNTIDRITKNYIKDLISIVGLEDRMTHKPGELSGGECQRTALLRALVNKPQIIIADEPTGNLDEKTTRVIFGLIKKLNKKYKFTFIIATHNLLVKKYTHQFYVLKNGKLLKK